MVGCGRCDDWFHGDCVGLDLMKIHEMEEEDQMYVCLKCCAEETIKVEPDVQSAAKPEEKVKHEVKDTKPPPKPGQGSSQSLTSAGVKPVKKDPDRRPSTELKSASQKPGGPTKQDRKSKSSPTTVKKPVSVEEIRRSVRDSLKDILLQRLKDCDLNVTSEKASEVAKKTERELFHLYKDTDTKYKSKYRSLMFNLKDTKNNVLFRRVLKGEISPGNLIRMSPEELASKELAAWRQRENRHTIEMIEKEQREAERRPITKITHKGEIEIESQEPAKAPETVELEPAPKVSEEAAALQPIQQKSKGPKIEKDTTNQHKAHLFDLHCKICTGHMAPPVEEAPTKVVKVATTVARRQSSTVEESNNTPPVVPEDDIHFTVLEESFRNAQLSSADGRSEFTSGRVEEAAFLSNLKSFWRGFINMPAVAKLVTKAFPVSGILDKLTEDLPESIQVGGRISPQTVWDYLEKIRATGTKEVCLIRFSPETEEDEISYTLLYAYFSSRRRFGVVSNNLKQVKDMYLIPLGAAEKVPHQLVPFDGPGLEINRSNLLLGLIIRQRPKKDFLPVEMNEVIRIIPESKPPAPSTNDTRAAGKDEKFFLPSLKPVYTKEPDILLKTTEETVDEPITESFEEASATEEASSQESYKPLRFLPGVLVGWGGELPPLPDVGGRPTSAADDPQRPQPAPNIDAATPGISTKSLTPVARLDRFVIKKKEPKSVKAEPEQSNPTDKPVANNSTRKDGVGATHITSVSLKDKPPDVSTETFLASLAPAQSGTDTSSAVSSNKGDGSLLSETERGKPEGSIVSHSKPQAASENAISSKPPLSGILKKSSAYFGASKDKKTEVEPTNKASDPDSLNPQPILLLNSRNSDPTLASQQEQSHLSQAECKSGDEVQSNISEIEDPGTPVAGPMAALPANPPTVQGQQVASCAPTQTEDSLSQYDSVVPPAVSTQPQVPGSYGYPSGPAPNVLPTPDTQSQNSAPWAQDGPVSSPAPQGVLSQYLDSFSESSGRPPTLAKDFKRPEERYSDPWERPRHTEERDHYGRHSHHSDAHQGKKNKHHEREHGSKHERAHEDKYRERSRHHGHSEDRYGERRKERHYSDDYSNRHKDKHRHRRL
ncbi:PHD finger protein 3 isoform X2 [Lampris incognitus]|nr:PHD finger protein 3 isoform X2 [Lampris incognitus]